MKMKKPLQESSNKCMKELRAAMAQREVCRRVAPLLGNKNLLHAIHGLVRVFDIQKGCLRDKPLEAAFKHNPQPAKVQEVSVVQPSMEFSGLEYNPYKLPEKTQQLYLQHLDEVFVERGGFQRQSLVEAMSIEAIAAFKAKRLAHKKENQDERTEEQRAALAQRAMERERQHRTRDELLLGNKELPGVMCTLARVFDCKKLRLLDKPREAAIKPLAVSTSQPQPAKLREVPVVPPQLEPSMQPSGSKYNRYGQEKFLKPKQDFGINPLGTNVMKNSATKQPRGTLVPMRVRRLPPEGMIPSRKVIIVVPEGLTSLITLHNVKQLLQDMRYESSEKMRQLGPQHLDEVIIERRFQGDIHRFRVIDNVSRLSADEWERVAAVFAVGPNWQFKGWPYNGDAAIIFHRICAFHLHFKDTPIHRDLKNMKVIPLSLPQYERHLDCGILMEFWNKLDQHIALNQRQFAFMKQK